MLIMTKELNDNTNLKDDRPWNPLSIWLRRISYICTFVFFINLAVGKSSQIMGWKIPPLVDGVSEFLLLLFIVVMFIAALMIDELGNKKNNIQQESKQKT
jgi:hypothetical protein